MSETSQSFEEVAPFLLDLRLTPLLRSEVEHVITLHQQNRDSPYVLVQQELEQARHELTQRWNRFFNSPFYFATHEAVLSDFAKTVGGLIFSEYAPEHVPVETLPMAAYVWSYGDGEKRTRAVNAWGKGDASEMDREIDLNMTFLISEFMLDREHIESRFRATCEEKNLARTLLQQENRLPLDDLMAKDEQVLKQFASYFKMCQVVLDMVAVKMDQDFRPQSMQDEAGQRVHVENIYRVYNEAHPGQKLEEEPRRALRGDSREHLIRSTGPTLIGFIKYLWRGGS